MKATQLKALCKEYNLKVSGSKTVLQERLREAYIREAKARLEPAPSADDGYELMEVDDLQDVLRTRGLNTKGIKSVLIQRLREDSKTLSELMKATPEEKLSSLVAVLEAASKESLTLQEYLQEKDLLSGQNSKFVNVTITSLGLEPEKFTAGGAPSVTADVLRKLAGSPFSDPPEYGSVSYS